MNAVASTSGSFSGEKRKGESLEENVPSKRSLSWHYVLGSETEYDTEKSESVHSIQQKSTDYAKDTSDTSTKSSWSNDELHMIQYEVVSLSEDERGHPFPIDSDSSTGPDDIICSSLKIELNSCHNSDTFANISSASSSSNSVDPELSCADFWTCVQCKEENNNPLFRYCEKCYKIRKNFFPPRPERKKSRQKPRKRPRKYTNSAGSSELGETPICQSECLINNGTSTEMSGELIECYIPKTPPADKEVPLCETCFNHPKDGGYVHGNIVHVYNCYKCAVKILKQRGKCPICNRQVRQVLKVIMF